MKKFQVYSYRTNKMYWLCILGTKDKSNYKIYNITNNYLSNCTFNTYEEAENDIYQYQKDGKNKIIQILEEN